MDPIEALLKRRDELQEHLDKLLETPTTENRNFTDAEDAEFKKLADEIRGIDDRVVELRDLVKRQEAAAEARQTAGETRPEGGAHVEDAPVYTRSNARETSFFRDLFYAQQRGDRDAYDRLVRSTKQTREQLAKSSEEELRALGNTGAAGGSGGEFAPPLWQISDFVQYMRPGRKFADSIGADTLPSGISSINMPSVTGGTTTAIQTTQNTALSQTDMTTGSVSATIVTIGGKQVVSMQLLQQSAIPFDRVVLRDLAADYAKQFGNQVINGSGASGQLKGVYTYFNASGTVNVTYTSGAPTVGGSGANSFYSKIFSAAAAIEAARFMPPDTIWMHPRRWAWVLAGSDTQSRPLVVPATGTQSVNAIGDTGALAAQGVVGNIGGLDVITDPQIPINTGAGTNQDPVFVGVRGDLLLWESPLQLDSFTATYADSAGILFRALAYSAAMPNRYTSSVSIINGTGLVLPVF